MAAEALSGPSFGALATEMPDVTEIDAGDDRLWFGEHLARPFRARPGDGGIWLVRRQNGVALRIFQKGGRLSSDTDNEIAQRWYQSAFPSWSAEQVKRAARRALTKGA